MKEKVKLFEQRTFETCLAMSLLFLVDKINPIKVVKKLELDCIVFAMKYSKQDFIIGHLEFINRKFKIKFNRIVDNKTFFSYLKKFNFVKNFKTEVKKIDLKLIDNFLLKSKVIIYIDSYLFYKISHMPHFVVVMSKKNQKYEVFDPWDGKIKLIEAKRLSMAISSLRNHLKLCPEILF